MQNFCGTTNHTGSVSSNYKGAPYLITSRNMLPIGICKLCLTPNVPLLGSHIVPEFFYKRIYTKSHKFTAIAQDAGERLAVEQKGYREHLLCRVCETKLSKWEGKLSQFSNEIIADAFTTCVASKIGNVTCLTGVAYSSMKMAVISIFWRMGIASQSIFESYDLGPYSDEFRQILDKNRVLSKTEFPILISKGLLDGQFLPGILFPVGRGRYDNNLIMQSVVLNGIAFDCMMTSTRAIPNEVLEFSLLPTGRVLIPARPYEELGMNVGDFSKRMKKEDVKSFFAKYA